MSDAALTLGDAKRGRFLLGLLVAAIVATALGIFAVISSRDAVAPTITSELMFPGLGESAAKTAQIRIEGPNLKLTLNKGADGKWSVAERDGYPANPDGIRSLIVSLTQLTLIEKRTADPARQAALQLSTGDGGTGYSVTLQGADGAIIASVVAGKVATRAAGTTPGTLFVRRGGEDQVWLARGIVAVPASVAASLDKALFPIDRNRIMRASFAPHAGKPFTIARDKIDGDYALSPLPDGKRAEPLSLLTPATAIGGFGFNDVAKAATADMKDAGTVSFETFDGLIIKATVKPAGDDADADVVLEASVDATQAAAAPPPAEGKAKVDAQKEADAINARVQGWVYKVPGYVAGNLMPPLDSLVKDKAEPAPATPAPDQPLSPAPDPGEPPAAPPAPK